MLPGRPSCPCRLFDHQEDDTLLGVTWCDLVCLALLGTLANKPSYSNSASPPNYDGNPQLPMAFAQV